jgi:uncharacterized protein (TIGR01777 family)
MPAQAFHQVEAVIHLAGESVGTGRWTQKKKGRILHSRVEGTRRLVEGILAYGKEVRALLAASAIGIYGDRGDEWLNENSSPGGDFLARVCRGWEAETAPLGAAGVRVLTMRFGLVLSEKGGLLEPLINLFSTGLGGRIGSGAQWMSWIHLDDLVEGILTLLRNEEVSGPVNFVAPNPVTNAEFSRRLASALGTRLFLPVPQFALRLALGEKASLALGSQRVRAGQPFSFRYSRLEDALKAVCANLRSGQKIFQAEQWAPQAAEEIFPFFGDEKNLEAITPPFLHFQVLGKNTPEIREGTLIDYRLSLHGLPMKWRSRVERWEPGRCFVDIQVHGPFRKWHHTHEFLPLGGGTLFSDRVLYRLPFGWLGNILAGWKVKRDVAAIFAYRRRKISARFPR